MLLLHLSVCVEVVETLGQEAGHIDAVGGSELHPCIEFFVHESTLNKRLAVIEDTIHLYRCNVLPERCELTLLYGADLSLRVEHIDMDAFNSEETVGNGRTCIAAGGNEDIDGPLLTPPLGGEI